MINPKRGHTSSYKDCALNVFFCMLQCRFLCVVKRSSGGRNPTLELNFLYLSTNELQLCFVAVGLVLGSLVLLVAGLHLRCILNRIFSSTKPAAINRHTRVSNRLPLIGPMGHPTLTQTSVSCVCLCSVLG